MPNVGPLELAILFVMFAMLVAFVVGLVVLVTVLRRRR